VLLDAHEWPQADTGGQASGPGFRQGAAGAVDGREGSVTSPRTPEPVDVDAGGSGQFLVSGHLGALVPDIPWA